MASDDEELPVFQNGKLAGALRQRAQVVAGDRQSHGASVHNWMPGAQLVDEVEPPCGVARVKSGERIVQEQEFRLEGQSAGEAASLPEVGVEDAGHAVCPGR